MKETSFVYEFGNVKTAVGKIRYLKQMWDGSQWIEYHVYDDSDSANIEYLENVILCSPRFCSNTADSGVFMKSLTDIGRIEFER